MALDKGETALAEVARRKAEQVDSESLGNTCIRYFFDYKTEFFPSKTIPKI